MDDVPTSDAGYPQEALIGHTDVNCLDDTPNVLHNLRVHPVGQPDTVALVGFTNSPSTTTSSDPRNP